VICVVLILFYIDGAQLLRSDNFVMT